MRLKGIGGPGAPHCIQLERLESSGVQSAKWFKHVQHLCELLGSLTSCCSYNISIMHWFSGRSGKRYFGFPILGQTGVYTEPFRCHLEDHFWNHVHGQWEPCSHRNWIDTVKLTPWIQRPFNPFVTATRTRTKQWMSDGTWQPTTFLFLPASVARAAQGDGPPGTWFPCWLVPVGRLISIIHGSVPHECDQSSNYAPQSLPRRPWTLCQTRTRRCVSMPSWCVLTSDLSKVNILITSQVMRCVTFHL